MAMEKTPWRILSSISRRVGDERPFNRLAWSCELRCCNHVRFDFGDRGGFALGTHRTFSGAIARAASRLVKILPTFPERQKP